MIGRGRQERAGVGHAGGLLKSHPPVQSDGPSRRCGLWTAGPAEAEDVLVLDADAGDEGDGLDGLRALCVAHWARHPDDGAPARVVARGERAAAALQLWGLVPDGTQS